jgi:hypothetical protein
MDVDPPQASGRRDVLVDAVAATAQRARQRTRTNLDDRSRRNLDRTRVRAARRQRGEQLSIGVHGYEDNVRDPGPNLGDRAGMCDAATFCMGYVSRHRRRDLSKYESVYEHPDFEALGYGLKTRDDKLTAGMIAGGSSIEMLGGLAAVILAVLGFSSRPIEMCAIATIAVGIGLLAQGAAIMTRWRHALRKAQGTRLERHELVEGTSMEVFGGVIGIVLGTLALATISPAVLLPVAAIVFGASLLLGGVTQPDLVYLAPEKNPRFARMTFSAIQASGGVMVLVGVAAAVLGILGLVMGPPVMFALVAMLCIGFTLVLAGSALTARFVRRFT